MKGYTMGKLVLLAMVALALEVTLLETFSIGGARPEALLRVSALLGQVQTDEGQHHRAGPVHQQHEGQ